MGNDSKRHSGKAPPPPKDDAIDEALKQTFPASDPPAFTTPHAEVARKPASDKASRKPKQTDRGRPRSSR